MASSLLSPSFTSFLRTKVAPFINLILQKALFFLHPFCPKVLTLLPTHPFLSLSEGSLSLCFHFSAMLQSGAKENNPLCYCGASAPTFHHWISSVFFFFRGVPFWILGFLDFCVLFMIVACFDVFQVRTAMTMTEKILARASEKAQLTPGDNVWVNVDILMTHDVCGPGSIGIFKREFGEDAKVSLLIGWCYFRVSFLGCFDIFLMLCGWIGWPLEL